MVTITGLIIILINLVFFQYRKGDSKGESKKKRGWGSRTQQERIRKIIQTKDAENKELSK
jgi:hypothetical protein